MELYSEISRLVLTKDEKTALHRYFTKEPTQKVEAIAILSTCEDDNEKVQYLKSLLEKTTSIEQLLITQFSQPLTNPPSENELEVYLKHLFLQKIPIRHKHGYITRISILNLGDYFIDEDVGQTGDTVSSLCEAAIMLTITGSENNLISEYDALVDRNVVDTSGATLKMFRLDLIVLLHDVLIFKAEEKKDFDEFDNAVKELESKMEIWDPSLFGDLPYLPSYAAAKEQFQWCIIRRDLTAYPISPRYNLSLLLHRVLVLISAFNMFCLLVTLEKLVTISRPHNNLYVVFLTLLY
ncbi:10602_t:CDS:2 [Funneliformis mosseae]|uniref:10602_t:CDS:1 n=1 Tax=Funneliformis mosseae TaxID=27381 RepID=A0A9N9H135_FUNMO|nr:10602_t:CDS:2 [Funneliformis mosseae]